MKTAVEWYCEKSIDILEELRAGKMTFAKWFKEQAVILKQAKEMEREQIVKAVDAVQIVHRKYFENGWTGEDILGKEVPTTKDRTYFGLSKNGEQYYNETFKQQEQ